MSAGNVILQTTSAKSKGQGGSPAPCARTYNKTQFTPRLANVYQISIEDLSERYYEAKNDTARRGAGPHLTRAPLGGISRSDVTITSEYQNREEIVIEFL
jgi:hypothetical protein